MTTFDVLAPSPLPPPRDPAWRGIDVGVVLIATAFSIVLALLLGAILLPIFVPMHAAFSATDTRFMLVAQTLGFAGGFGFAALWITRLYQVPFWRAIHWTPLHGDQIWRLATLGVVLSLGLQGLEHFLPIPRKLPIDRLFTPQTAWLLAIYGVVVAPFFEEFLFRGLIYPSLRRSFEEGMTTAEARGWEPFVWLGAFAAVAVAGLGMLLRTLRGAPAEPRLRLIVVGAQREAAHRLDRRPGLAQGGEKHAPHQPGALGVERGGAAVDVVIAGPAGGELKRSQAERLAGKQGEQAIAIRHETPRAAVRPRQRAQGTSLSKL